MLAIKRINNEINRKFPKNILDLYTSYNLSFLSYDTDFTNSDYITLSVDIYNTYCSSFKQLFTINLYKTYPFTPPRPLINTKYGNKNYNRWCGDITNTINKRLFLSSTNILIASFFSIDMNTTLYKKFKNTPVKFPINFPISCLCCESITCPGKWNPGCQIKHVIEEYMFNKKFLFFTSHIGLKLIMPIFYNERWNIPDDILLHIFLFII